MTPAAQWTIEKAGSAIDAGMGLILGNINDKRQLRQQRKLQALGIEGTKELRDYENEKQLELWKKTNFSAQMEEAKKAGLNPGLLYGMGGAGGASTGGGGASAGGGHAPTGGGETTALMEIGMQKQLMAANLELIKAQTQKTQAEATKTAGVDTSLGETQIKSLTQGIANQQAAEAFTKIQTELGEIQRTVQGKTMEDAVKLIQSAADKMTDEARSIGLRNQVDQNTVEEKIKMIRAELAGVYLGNILTEAQGEESKSRTQLNTAQVKKWQEEILQGWKGLSLTEKMNKVTAIMNEVEQFYKGSLNQWNYHDKKSIAAQIDEIMGIGKEDFKKK